MIYEIRNQYDNIPYVAGLTEEIIHLHNNGATSLVWDGESIDILGHSASDGKTTINIYIHSI